jgi:hypothetical protein
MNHRTLNHNQFAELDAHNLAERKPNLFVYLSPIRRIRDLRRDAGPLRIRHPDIADLQGSPNLGSQGFRLFGHVEFSTTRSKFGLSSNLGSVKPLIYKAIQIWIAKDSVDIAEASGVAFAKPRSTQICVGLSRSGETPCWATSRESATASNLSHGNSGWFRGGSTFDLTRDDGDPRPAARNAAPAATARAPDAKSVRRELPHELPLRQNGTDALDGFWVLRN